jgi:methylamine---glutamate N-methyltransferase subunit A
MCGIVGLHLRSSNLEPRLGELMTLMLAAMTTRGPDSAGVAIYSEQVVDASRAQPCLRYSVRSDGAIEWDLLAQQLGTEIGSHVASTELAADSAVLISDVDEAIFLSVLRRIGQSVALAGYGRAMMVVKDVGTPAEICSRYGIMSWTGYQGIGHTRMATESAVTTAHSHPFAPAADVALVHNGSFSNYDTVRRRLARTGIRCETDNDSEVAARLVAARMAEGDDLKDALRHTMKELDGFFTLLVSTREEFAVVRDSFACKPAVIAQTDDYIAMASEYQALTSLPGIGDADVFEPVPEEIYVWSR